MCHPVLVTQSCVTSTKPTIREHRKVGGGGWSAAGRTWIGGGIEGAEGRSWEPRGSATDQPCDV